METNKILGAILGTALFISVLRILGGVFFPSESLEKNAYPVAVSNSGGEAGAPAAAAVDLPKLLADAKADRGGRIAEKCLSCHTFVKGGPNGTGPNLWGVVGGPTAHLGGAFGYSTAMLKFGGQWTYERLFGFLENPQNYLSGTKMTFAGLSKASDRADVIAYLRTQTDSPPPLPEVKAAAPAAAPGAPGAAPAAGAAPEGAAAPAPGAAAPAAGPPAASAGGGSPAAATPPATTSPAAATPSAPAKPGDAKPAPGH